MQIWYLSFELKKCTVYVSKQGAYFFIRIYSMHIQWNEGALHQFHALCPEFHFSVQLIAYLLLLSVCYHQAALYFRSIGMNPFSAFSKLEMDMNANCHMESCVIIQFLFLIMFKFQWTYTMCQKTHRAYKQCAQGLLKIWTDRDLAGSTCFMSQCCAAVSSPNVVKPLADCPGWATGVTGECCYCC